MQGAHLVQPEILSRLDNLELVARSVVDGFINGLHRAAHLGLSLDFAEHRGYEPGDDLRRVDWRVYGRTDRFYVKQFEADSNANLVVALDQSRSMQFGGGSVTKLDYGRFLAASLLYFSHLQRDRVGLVTFDREVVDYVPPSARHLEAALFALDRMASVREGLLGPPLLRVADRLVRRGVVAVISDLYEDPQAVIAALRPLRARGHDVIVFHVLDPAELDFPFEDSTSFEDLESGERVPVVTGEAREQYRSLIQAHLAAISRLCVDVRIDYALFNTSMPLGAALFRYLSSRERLRRVR